MAAPWIGAPANHSHHSRGIQGSAFKTATEAMILNEAPTNYLSLLDRKVQEAEDELKRYLSAQLYGRKPEKNPLRQAIADAYDQVTHEAAISSTLATYKDRITEQVFKESPILKGLSTYRQEYPDMTDSTCIARAAVAKRAEKRAAKRVDRIGDFLDENEWEDGETLSWTVNFKGTANKTYHYVAVKGGANWFITGDPNRYDDDAFTAKLVALSLDGKVHIKDWDEDL
jgi:hypothetical protein